MKIFFTNKEKTMTPMARFLTFLLWLAFAVAGPWMTSSAVSYHKQSGGEWKNDKNNLGFLIVGVILMAVAYGPLLVGIGYGTIDVYKNGKKIA
jgi:hypothetical protein